ncbi:DUF4271 domain-containing protein [Bacteroidota bacterium]
MEDSATSLRKFSTEQVDDIFKAMEKKERELDSIARVRAYYSYLRSLKQPEPVGFDTSAVPYFFDQDSLPRVLNPLKHFSTSYYSSKDSLKPVFIERAESPEIHTLTEPGNIPFKTDDIVHDLRPVWLLGIIIGSLLLLAFLKLFYNKFLDQTMQAVSNYQLSTKLLRDHNIFSRRVAFALNVNFILVGAAFIYLILGHFHIRPFPLNDFISYLAYAGILAVILILRFLSCYAIGHIFNKLYEFREYLHQLLLIYKSLGIYLLILVIGIAYIREDLRIYLVYLSALLLATAGILRIIKGVKILLNKDISLLYLILYLCTLEILPLLIFYKFFSSLVLTG